MASTTVNGCCKDDTYWITAIGNPNVDLIVKVDDTYLFDKYNLAIDGHLPTHPEFMDKVRADVFERNYEVLCTPGGCAQNTLRVLQWLIGDPSCKCAMIGSIGVDKEAEFLEKEMKKAGVNAIYTKLNDYRTASVIGITYQKNRSFVYGLKMGAASQYSLPMLLANPDAVLALKRSKIVHLEAFFTIHSMEVGLEVLKICSSSDAITSFNLCGEYTLKMNKNAVIAFYDVCDIVIGNLPEFYSLCDELSMKRDHPREALEQLHRRIMNNAKNQRNYAIKSFEKYGKIIIATNGSEPVYCYTKCDGFIEFPIPAVDPGKIKDTTGAGDAFLAGFLYGILHDAPITKCLELGYRMGAEIIQQHGCVLPDKDPAIFTDNL